MDARSLCAIGVVACLVVAMAPACGSGDSDLSDGGGGGGPGADVPTDPLPVGASDFTYRLEESTAELTLWTTPATHRAQVGDRAPEATGSGLSLTAARNEYEPVQLLLGPGEGEVEIVALPVFAGIQTALALAGYESGIAESLTPLIAGDLVSLRNDAAVPVWITVYVPDSASAGAQEAALTLRHDGAAIDVPIALLVYDFTLPALTHFATQLNIDVSSLIVDGGTVDDAKDLLFEHRLTPKSVTWPSGFNWSITWENARSSAPCEVFWDEPDEPDAYSIGQLSRRSILGEGWNGVGFPNAMIFQFVDNGTPRPASFCGLDRGDHFGTAAYNAEWSQFLGQLESYLDDNGMLERAYYYVQNEPQNDEDHRLAAHLCRLTRAAAPGLRIAVSEEPKPEIAEDPDGACGYDIWIAHVRAYQQGYAWERQRDHGEDVWLYSLDHDPDPFFNPTVLTNQGMHTRIIPWVSWVVRARGWAYYDAGRFFDGPRPSVRAELLREGIEDYEYLILANGGEHPGVFVDEPVDVTVRSVASSLTSWSRDPDALMALRHELGRYLEGSRDSLPVLEVDSGGRPRDAYHVNFQDPTGRPDVEPLVVEGRTYLKVGWQTWSDDDGLGWSGEYVGNADIALYGYDAVDGYDEVERSYLYDDYGRRNLFEFALENGRYEVTVGVGRPARGYPGDPHNLTVEGEVLVDDEPTTNESPTIVRSTVVDLLDGSLSLEMGGRSELTGDFAYTFVAFLRVVPVE